MGYGAVCYIARSGGSPVTGRVGALRICWDSGKDNRWSRAISLQGFDLLTENRRGLVVRNLSRSHCSIAFSDSSTGRSVP